MTRSQENRLGSDPAFATDGTMLHAGFQSGSLGLSKREYIATLALQGILASPNGYNDVSFEGAARDAVAHADSLLEELAK